MQVQSMTLFLVIGVLTAAPALAIKIDRRPSPDIDEPPLMNASRKVEPILASGGGGAAAADHLRPGSLGAVQVSEQVEEFDNEITTERTAGDFKEIFAPDGKPGHCGCEKGKTYNHISKWTPASLEAAKMQCKKMTECTGIVWAPKAPWEMTVKSQVKGMVTGTCGSKGFDKPDKAWHWNAAGFDKVPYKCFMKDSREWILAERRLGAKDSSKARDLAGKNNNENLDLSKQIENFRKANGQLMITWSDNGPPKDPSDWKTWQKAVTFTVPDGKRITATHVHRFPYRTAEALYPSTRLQKYLVKVAVKCVKGECNMPSEMYTGTHFNSNLCQGSGFGLLYCSGPRGLNCQWTLDGTPVFRALFLGPNHINCLGYKDSTMGGRTARCGDAPYKFAIGLFYKKT